MVKTGGIPGVPKNFYSKRMSNLQTTEEIYRYEVGVGDSRTVTIPVNQMKGDGFQVLSLDIQTDSTRASGTGTISITVNGVAHPISYATDNSGTYTYSWYHIVNDVSRNMVITISHGGGTIRLTRIIARMKVEA